MVPGFDQLATISMVPGSDREASDALALTHPSAGTPLIVLDRWCTPRSLLLPDTFSVASPRRLGVASFSPGMARSDREEVVDAISIRPCGCENDMEFFL
jgi:hypothetical protein